MGMLSPFSNLRSLMGRVQIYSSNVLIQLMSSSRGFSLEYDLVSNPPSVTMLLTLELPEMKKLKIGSPFSAKD